MAPITCSASRPPTTPARVPATPQRASTQKSSAHPNGRKAPHCLTCHKPRKGHSRGRCPTPSRADLSQEALDLLLADAIRALHIGPEVEDVTVLADNSAEVDGTTKHRQEPGRVMPGTLPLPANSHGAVEPLSDLYTPTNTQRPDGLGEGPVSTPKASPLPRQPTAHSSLTPKRSASMSAREDFLFGLDRISSNAPVSVYTVSAADMEQLQPLAWRVGFHTAMVVPGQGDEALLVVGTDDKAVNDVHDKLLRQESGMAKSSNNGLRQAAGGVLVGAAAVLAGLAL
ncbi:unnamed protein product [Peniophora sp. CBMAI 1063]|nr:unnamed protein product [Peniophora sp. CBMAI 1063]